MRVTGPLITEDHEWQKSLSCIKIKGSQAPTRKNIENKIQASERLQNMANQTHFEKLHSRNGELAEKSEIMAKIQIG